MAREIDYQPKVMDEVLKAFRTIQRISLFYSQKDLQEIGVDESQLGFEQILIEADRMLMLLLEGTPPPKDAA